MSRFREYGFTQIPADKTAADAAKTAREKSFLQGQATRYSGRSRGISSFRDKAELDAQILAQRASTSYPGDDDNGILNLAVCNKTGTPQPNQTFELGGRLFKTGNNGLARIADGEALNMEISSYNEVAEYELKVLRMVMMNNKMAEKLLGNAVFLKLEAAGAPAGITNAAIIATDAKPDTIQFLDPTSPEYARALVKMKAAVREAGVIINEDNQKVSTARPPSSLMPQVKVSELAETGGGGGGGGTSSTTPT